MLSFDSALGSNHSPFGEVWQMMTNEALNEKWYKWFVSFF